MEKKQVIDSDDERSWGDYEDRIFFHSSSMQFSLSKNQKPSITGYKFHRSLEDKPIEDSPVFQTLRTCGLRALILTKWESIRFVHALDPGRNQPVLHPNVEELMFYIDTNTHEESFREDPVEVASERPESSPKLSSVKICHGKEDFPLLREYVSHVEWKSTLPKWDAALGDAWDDYDADWHQFI